MDSREHDTHIHRDSIPPEAGDDQETIDFESLARLARSEAPPPPPDWEGVAATPAVPSTPAPGGELPVAKRVRLGRGSRLALGVALGLSLGVGGAVLKDALAAQGHEASVAAADVQADPAPPARVTVSPSETGTPAAAPTAPTVAPTAVDRAEGLPGAEPEAPQPEPAAPREQPAHRAAAPRPAATTPRAAEAPRPATADAPTGVAQENEDDAAAEDAAEIADADGESTEAVDPEPAEPVEPPAPAVAPGPPTLGGLMEAAVEPTPEPAAEPAPAPEPEQRLTPTRQDVTRAMDSIRDAIRQCAGDAHGLAELQITAGASGRVRSALVGGHFAGTPAGSCMARTARTVRFEPFDRDTFTVRYPFRL